MMSTKFGLLVLGAIASTLLAGGVAAAGCQYGPQRRTLPESIESVVSVPNAVSADTCDKLAAQVTKATRGKFFNGTAMTTLQLDKDAVAELIAVGLLGTAAADAFASESTFGAIWEVPATAEIGSTRIPHVDVPPDGKPFDTSTLVYLTDAKGALHFPETGESVAITKGTVVAFPAGTVHSVVDSEPRIFLGPFGDSNALRRKRRMYCDPRDPNCPSGGGFDGGVTFVNPPPPALTAAPTAVPTAAPTAAPTEASTAAPTLWETKPGCCRERNSKGQAFNHHATATKETISPATKLEAMTKCTATCDENDACTAVEVTAKKATTSVCEFHTSPINSATRASKSCKKAVCKVKVSYGGVNSGVTRDSVTLAPTPAPPAAPWTEKRGCCRQVDGKNKWHSHQDTATDQAINGASSFSAAAVACKAMCQNDAGCTAAEVRQQKKKKTKQKNTTVFRCELHSEAINSSTRGSKSCKKATCSIKAIQSLGTLEFGRE